MEKVEIIDLEFGICQPCPGVWYWPIVPTEQLKAGKLLSKSNFREACDRLGQRPSTGTLAFHQLIFSLEQLYRDEYYTDTYYGLKNPQSKRTKSFYIDTKAAQYMHHKSSTGKNLLMGYGEKAFDVLTEVLAAVPTPIQ